MKEAADIEDQQRLEDLERTAESNVRKQPIASFRPPVPTAVKDVVDEIGSAHTKDSVLRMSAIFFFLKTLSPVDF